MYRHHSISDVFAWIHQKKGLRSRFKSGALSSIHRSVFLFLVLALIASISPLSTTVNAQSGSGTFQPTRSSIYGTFYYPWYKNPTVDGAWSYWQDNNYSPPNSWFSNYLPLRPGALDSATGTIHPAAGLYSSRDKDAFYWQLNAMAQAKLEIAISSWWGRSVSASSDSAGPSAVEGKSDFTFRKILQDWMNLADNPYPNLRWTLYYEKEGAANPTAAEIAADLAYIHSDYANQPAFLKIDGRPVIFAYGDASDGCATVDRWLQARAQTGVNFYLVLKLFSGYTNCSSQPDSWHEYAPAARSGTHSTYSSFISPGFWKVGDPVRLARNLSEFDTAAAAMVATNTKWKLVQTWNEWGEGTSVEPGIQVQQTRGGTASLALNGAPFEDKYIQVLSQRFPALQAGTGAGGAQAATATPVPTQAQTASPAPGQPSDAFVFSAGGDIGANSRADASLRSIVPSGAAFFLALGDLDYDETSSDAAWCDYVKQRVGTTFPFEVLTGNHEEGSASSPGPDGYIGNHAACLPDYFAAKPVIPGQPAYPANYYFDYPLNKPIMRFILISANLKYAGVQYNFNRSEQTNYNALAARIDEAKQAGMWVMLGTHKDCLTTGDKSCEIGADLTNLLISKKVDLVLQGHDHNYQRSKQIALGNACTGVTPGAYNPNCIVDDGSDNVYNRGAGTLFLINGVVGRCCYNVKATDAEAGYFIKTVGVDGVNTNGFVTYTVSASRIDAHVVNSVGTWGDSFSIVAQPTGATTTPNNTPVPPTATITSASPTATVLPAVTSTVVVTLAPTATATVVPPTFTATATTTVVQPSSTPISPTATFTSLPSTPTPNGPTLTVEMNPSNAAIGATVSAELKLSNMSNLYGLQAECMVDPNVLTGIGYTVGSIFTGSNSFIVDGRYQSDGNWSVAGSLLNPVPAFNDSGTAFSLNYKVMNVGHTTVECTALAVDVNGNVLPISVVNGSFDGTQAPAATGVPTSTPPISTPASPTPTPLPTLTPTLEPTLPPIPGAISGVVKYENRPDQTGITVTVSQNGAPLVQGQSSADGSFQFNAVPAGQYGVQFSAQGHLSASTSIDVQAGQGATLQVTLLAGDIDNNGVVDLTDAGFIGANYSVQVPPAPAQADLNGDGFINLVDLVLVGKNFGKTAQ